MHWESSGVVRFHLGPIFEGQMRTAKLKSAYNSLIIGPTGFGALSLWWIQFASVLRCAKSSFSGTELIPLFPYLRAGLLKSGGGRRVGLDWLTGFCWLTIASRVLTISGRPRLRGILLVIF